MIVFAIVAQECNYNCFILLSDQIVTCIFKNQSVSNFMLNISKYRLLLNKINSKHIKLIFRKSQHAGSLGLFGISGLLHPEHITEFIRMPRPTNCVCPLANTFREFSLSPSRRFLACTTETLHRVLTDSPLTAFCSNCSRVKSCDGQLTSARLCMYSYYLLLSMYL